MKIAEFLINKDLTKENIIKEEKVFDKRVWWNSYQGCFESEIENHIYCVYLINNIKRIKNLETEKEVFEYLNKENKLKYSNKRYYVQI